MQIRSAYKGIADCLSINMQITYFYFMVLQYYFVRSENFFKGVDDLKV